MVLKVITSDDSREQIIQLTEKFDFEDHLLFRDAVRDAMAKKMQRVILDLEETTYIDSSALGMMMLAKHKCEEVDCEVILKHPRDMVKRVLETVSFEKQFTIIPYINA